MFVNTLKVKWLGIDSRQEHIIFMREDCLVCRAEGFDALTRVLVKSRDRTITATIHTISSDLLHHHHEASITKDAWNFLG